MKKKELVILGILILTIVFPLINALTWTSIGTSYADGNASSICSGAEALLGNGTCANSSAWTSAAADTWLLNYTDYYNKSDIDDNFSLYFPFTGLGSELTNDLGWITSYVDTNASSICSGAEALLGNGTCVNSSIWTTAGTGNASWNESYAREIFITNDSNVNLYDVNTSSVHSTGNITILQWFVGLFDWITDDDYTSFNGSTLSFNETKLNNTIDKRTNSTTYSATQITTIDGTLDSGNLASIQTPEDGDSYNVSEDVGESPLTIDINFTGVSDFDAVIGRIYYEGGQGHEIQAEIRRTDTGAWENYEEYTDMTDFVNIHFYVYDVSNHIDGSGNVSIRFSHAQSGIPTHNFFIDYLAIVDGWTALTTADHDGLGGRDSIENHPWAMDTGARRNFTNNLTFLNDSWITNLSGLDLQGAGIVTNYSNRYTFADFLLDTTGADGNASSICDGAEVLLGNTTCQNSSIYLLTNNDTYHNYVTANYTNKSNYWDGMNTTNSTQMEDSGGVLNILESWLTSFIDNWLSEKSTDDLSEGSTNKYDNESWNQSLADGLYSGGADGNASSICSGGEFLMGNGTCMNYTNLPYEEKSTSGETVFKFSDNKLMIKVT